MTNHPDNPSSSKTVFLGGTCNGSRWRDELIPKLSIVSFNPVVAEWNEAAQAAEVAARENSDYVLYVVTPKMTGVYSIAEAVEDSNKRPEKTVFCYLAEDDGATFTPHQLKSLVQTGKLIAQNGGKVAASLEEVAMLLV
jgi:hypothetical protein